MFIYKTSYTRLICDDHGLSRRTKEREKERERVTLFFCFEKKVRKHLWVYTSDKHTHTQKKNGFFFCGCVCGVTRKGKEEEKISYTRPTQFSPNIIIFFIIFVVIFVIFVIFVITDGDIIDSGKLADTKKQAK